MSDGKSIKIFEKINVFKNNLIFQDFYKVYAEMSYLLVKQIVSNKFK